MAECQNNEFSFICFVLKCYITFSFFLPETFDYWQRHSTVGIWKESESESKSESTV